VPRSRPPDDASRARAAPDVKAGDPKTIYKQRLKSAEDAARLLRPVDQLAGPIAAGQPVALLRALGKREDWRDLRVLSGLFLEPFDLFSRPGVRLVSGFFGPVERALRAGGLAVDYLVSNFRGQERALRRARPRVVAETVSPMDEDGYMTFGVHAGATFTDFAAAGRDPDRVLIVEVNPNMPAVAGLPEYGGNRVHVSEVDAIVESDEPLFEIPDFPPSEAERTIARLVSDRIDHGATLQFGIGGVPGEIAEALLASGKGEFGIHTEMFGDGIMKLHEAGKVANRKGVHDGVSVGTFALGSRALYRWLDRNPAVRMLPVERSNDPAIIRANRRMTSVNTALSVDLQGQIVAEAIGGRQYSGTGGQEDFVMGAHECPDGKSFLVFTSTVEVGGARLSRIVPRHPEGAVITTPRYHVQFIVTEHGAVDLSDLTDVERAEAIATLADAEFRPALEEEARRLARALRGAGLPGSR
jgi:acyl-CoA hydrolase